MDASYHSSRTRSKKAKAKGKPSSSSRSPATTTTCPDSSSSAPPRLHLISLPALVHNAISSFLPSKDRLRVMEVDHWASRTYGACVKQLVLRHVNRDDNVPIQSILKRCPILVELTIPCCNRMTRQLAEAMAEGSCDKLQKLELGDLSPYSRGIRACLSPMLDALGYGACPNITHLSLSFGGSGNQADRDNVMKDLGGVLRSRMVNGCRGLKKFHVRCFTISALSPVLSSGACDKLEKLWLESCDLKGPASDALKEWLLRTKASRLHTFLGYQTRTDVIEALSSPGVARGLQALTVSLASLETVLQLPSSIEQGAWPDLRQLSVTFISRNGPMSNSVSRLIEAIRVGAPELRSLCLFNWWRMGSEGARIVAQSLRDGACPRLEELSLSYGSIGDVGVVELVKALMEGAACNLTLQRLKLKGCKVSARGMEELARAVTQGGVLPNLEGIQLGDNYNLRDQGVAYLAEAMKEGGLSNLKELGLTWVGMGTPGMLALSQALIDHHACPHLVRLDIRGTYSVSHEIKSALVNGLDASRGQGKVKVNL